MFEAVITHGSVTEAARQFGVTQPAVSAAIAKLERQVGFPLFRREGRRLLPTSEASLLHSEAARVLADFRRFGEVAAGITAGLRGTLTIATHPGPAIAWLPTLLAGFCAERPGVRLRLLTRSSGEVRDLAALSAFDIGLAEAPFTRGETLIHRYAFPRVAVLPEGHRLAKEAVLDPALLDNEGMVATVTSSWSWATVARTFEAAGATCRVVAECEFTAVAVNLVRAGLGVCVADPLSVAGLGTSGLAVRPFRPTLPYEVGLLAPAHGTLTRLAGAFAARFHDHVQPHLIGA